MLPAKLREFWRVMTAGERLLAVISFALYGWTIVGIVLHQWTGALAAMTVNGVVVLILMWSLRHTRGTGL